MKTFLFLFFYPLLLFAKEDTYKLDIYLFASSTCEECKSLKESFFPNILKQYTTVNLEHIKVDDIKSFKLQMLYERKYNIDNDESVKLFLGNKCLSGLKEIQNDFDKELKNILSNNIQTISPKEILELNNKSSKVNPANSAILRTSQKKNSSNSDSKIEDKFNTFGLSVVALSGLIDGINPCAFVTLVFFISVLSNLRKSQKDILLVGV